MTVGAMTRCAFDRCQAGGVILPPPAPAVVVWLPTLSATATVGAFMHPGCWAAEQRRMERP